MDSIVPGITYNLIFIQQIIKEQITTFNKWYSSWTCYDKSYFVLGGGWVEVTYSKFNKYNINNGNMLLKTAIIMYMSLCTMSISHAKP